MIALALGCTPPRERAPSATDLGEPSCPESAPPELVARGELRAGPVYREPSLLERFTLERRGCITVFRGRQEWAMSDTDLEVVYDSATMLPLRVTKRIVSAGIQAESQRTEERFFELRGERVAHTRRLPGGALEHWWIRGARPTAIIGPGRGVLTPWIQRAHLSVGGRARESVLDVRESMELIRDVTLARLEDRDDPILGRVRVYTIYGREPVFTDAHDIVVGDLMGLVGTASIRSSPDP